MIFRSLDFHGLNDLDDKIVNQLKQYLCQREVRVAHQILNIIQPHVLEASNPYLPLEGGLFKLSDAVEDFTKKVKIFSQTGMSDISQEKRQTICLEINKVLWEFAEILEGSVVELFQQIRQVSVDRWHDSVFKAVHAIKNILTHYIKDLVEAIRRLEESLRDYFQHGDSKLSLFKKWSLNFQSFIDLQLLKNLKQSEKYLEEKYCDFEFHYQNFIQIRKKTEELLERMKVFPVLGRLDMFEQSLYIDIFKLLKFIEMNPTPKGVLTQNIIRSLNNLASFNHILKILKKYHRYHQEAFFSHGLALKELNVEENLLKEQLKNQKEKVKIYQQELHQFLETMGHYRTFLLKNDPNPYVGARWGFSEWIVSPEPVKAKKLMQLMYKLGELNKNYEKFLKVFDRDRSSQERAEIEAHRKIENLLHEMGQPLISRVMIYNRAQELLNQLQICDEMGSLNSETICYFDGILSKAMREDWKYHVLQSFPLFHEIYRQHKGLSNAIKDPAHVFRLDRFHQLFNQIEEWIKEDHFYTHLNDIELDINDIKGYLQDFLATIQRVEKEKSLDPFLDETTERFKQQLLEYRYLFGQFLFRIQAKDSGKQLHYQFLFINQYFESIENLLFELKLSWEGKR